MIPVGATPARKVGGSYQADGWIVGRFKTLDGEDRVVFEFAQPPADDLVQDWPAFLPGLLRIFRPDQVEPREVAP